MASAFAGQIEIFAFPDPPAAWAACNGQLLPIQDYQMLYKLIGTTYGGDGKTTFGVPNIPPLGANGPFYYICLLGVTAQK